MSLPCPCYGATARKYEAKIVTANRNLRQVEPYGYRRMAPNCSIKT
jgi:hypothetical protein